jgi:hypothetical protein
MFMIYRGHVAAGLLFFCIGLPVFCFADAVDPCAEPKSKLAWDSGQNPVYTDAVELGRTLNARGFLVECILASKMADLFQGQKGAAWFKTNQGIFEVLFLPKSKTFAELKITLKPERNGRFVYIPRGTARSY